MPLTLDMNQYQRDGFVILDVLSPRELAEMRTAADAMMRREPFVSERKFHYLGLVMPATIDARLLESLDHPVLIKSIEAILGGGPLAMDNVALLAAEPGVSYRQGWHRDVLQVPQEHITDAIFSPAWRHNNVQLNMALADDAALWAVPGSHHRPNTAEERRAFGGTKHMSPVEAQMPGGICVKLKAGQAALYHNNIIHRGYCDFTTPRRTLHIGYHSVRHPPTWHFYNFDERTFTPEHMASLPENARKWVKGRAERRELYPDKATSFGAGFK